MSYQAGDSGHMQAHSDLVAAVNTELVRFGMAGDLPTKALGDEGHLDDHEAIRAALETIATTAGQTYSTALPPVRNLSDAGHPADHTALEACALEASGWPAWNDATGGTVTTFEDGQYPLAGRWRVHTFTASGTFTVSIGVHPFRVLVVGGGGAGGTNSGGGGGGGEVWQETHALAVKSYAVAVGTSGQVSALGDVATARAGDGGGGYGGHGGDSYYGTTTYSGHPPVGSGSIWGGGGAGNGGNAPGSRDGTDPGPGRSSDVTGTTVTYSAGGYGGWKDSGVETPDPAGIGNGGPGGRGGGGAGGPGHSGIVVVAYQIG